MSVYFATCREANAVKIGSSVDPWGRLPELQIGCPLAITIEAILPGGCEEEFRYHRWFADDRIHGEWFRFNETIEALIANNPAPARPENHKRECRVRQPKLKAAPVSSYDRYVTKNERKRYEAAMAETRAARMAGDA